MKLFVTSFVIHELLMPKPDGPFTKEENKILVEYTKQLFYVFKYRNIDKQMLECLFCSFMAGKVQKELNPNIEESYSNYYVNENEKERLN